MNEFKYGRPSTRGEPRLGHPIDRMVITILHKKLYMKKLSTRWMPRSLTVENKCNLVTLRTIVKRLLQRNSRGKWWDKFSRLYISERKAQDPYISERDDQNPRPWRAQIFFSIWNDKQI